MTMPDSDLQSIRANDRTAASYLNNCARKPKQRVRGRQDAYLIIPNYLLRIQVASCTISALSHRLGFLRALKLSNVERGRLIA